MDNDIPKPMSRFLKNQKRLNKSIAPSMKFQKQLNKLMRPNPAFENWIDEQQRIANMFIAMDPLKNIRHQMQFDSNKMEQWQKALDNQFTFQLPYDVMQSLKGFQIDQSIFEPIRSRIDFEQLNRIAEELEQESIYLGEYELLDEKKMGDEPSIILPPPLEDRYKSVNFIPIKIFQKVADDPSYLYKISPRDFENFVASLIDQLGFENIKVTPRSGDGGRDVIATKIVQGIPLLFAFECKRYAKKNKIQLETMRSLLGTVSHSESKANIGVLVTTSTFTSGTKKFIASESMLDGKDFHDLVSWINSTKC